tara:strand:- start:332 stop:745 length:414 start_codon:yes stop_codon:yes gene_type:complete
MFFKTILILMFNLISEDKINHIDQLKWNNRVLIIKNDKKIDFSVKIHFLNQEFDERDFIIVYVKQQNTFINNRKMSKYFSSSIFKKIKNINSNHTFILIGKDGQVKKTYPSEIEIKNIFIDVDRMPMRKYEMQIRKK